MTLPITCNTGRDFKIPAYNMTLSEKRAEAVETYLVAQGVAVNRISTEGLGPDFPVADNASNEGRQLNRRVEVILPNFK